MSTNMTAYAAGCERVFQTKVLPAFYKAREEKHKTGDPDSALPFCEVDRGLPDLSNLSDKGDGRPGSSFGPACWTVTTELVESKGGKAGFASEMFLRHCAERMYTGEVRLATAEEVLQWRREGEERKLTIQVMERKLANKRALTLEDATMPKALTPGSAAPATGYSATLPDGTTVTAPTAEALKSLLAALAPAPAPESTK